ncbi:Tat pathway signal protein [Streptomyces sp. CB02959]|uniref:Tat pathway signal protein n=1 Tax=Streptomyces sp. CB02959 TaxID=2020330 RepID=UPI000C274632|nr:Tat pathway signal protein [Streptomyces sp. CB02959]PJN30496.1 Tat pathway signal protein [Streptomyces sp. CB02959]
MSKIKSAFAMTATAAVLAAGALTTASTPAEAASGGRACLFLDKEGAPFAGRTYGHVAWAIRDPKNTNHWIWGATENAEGDSYTAPGKDNGSWIKRGTWDDLRKSIKRDGRHRKGYYDAYQCINTAGGDLKAAQRTFNNMKNNGYQILHNNCLTKAIAIFRKYSPALSSSRLPDGNSTPPRNYFKTTLDTARGWEKARTY